MDKTFVPSQWEEKLYKEWETRGTFVADSRSKKDPFSIILPPPNANADLHVGHAMYVYEDIMIRYNKLRGKEVLWLPGADHAGFETQFVYEKYLAKQGKSRFDYARDELYANIWDFVMQNRENMENQLRRLGFALDWEKKKFTLDEDVVAIVYETFQKMFKEGLIYRDLKLVNYSPFDGTAFSDLEVIHEEREEGLWHIAYKSPDNSYEIIVATTRPETLLGDTAVAVHPGDSRYKKLIGKKVVVPFVNRTIEIIGDDVVDPKFGTGAVKVTPAHDHIDWEIGKRHSLEIVQIAGFDGRMNENAGEFKGMKILQARAEIVNRLKENGLLVKEETITHSVPLSYKSGRPIEPLPKEQWFIKVRPLVDRAIKAVESGEIQIYPTRFKKVLVDWLDRFHDWNISRQIVWGIQIPAYQCGKDTSENGWFVSLKKPEHCDKCGESCGFVQDEDTFDTWFSSSQWPFLTLQAQKDPELYRTFYPTSIMETGYDILPPWVARMIMMGLYVTDKVPFKHVYLHGMVRDRKGHKMSKSKGNVVNPLTMVEKYGADALRATLVFQTTSGGDVNFTEDKIVGMRNFSNKIWNIGRFIKIYIPDGSQDGHGENTIDPKVDDILHALHDDHDTLVKSIHHNMHRYEIPRVFDELYEFIWHTFADIYIEKLKDELRSGNIKVLEELKKVFSDDLKLLHPFMPFVTEAVWKELYGEDASVFDQII